MRLHKARIADSVIGRANTDITPGLLHDDAEDSADVNTRLGRYGFDRLLDVGDLVVAVVEFHEAGVGLPEGGIGCPLVLVREVGGRAGILHVVSAAVGASSETGNLASAGLVCGCTWQLYDKADPEILGYNAGIRGSESVEADQMTCRDGAQGVTLSDGVATHSDGL